MLESVIGLIKGYAQDAIANNVDIPADKQSAAVEATTDALSSGFQNNLSGVSDLLSGKSSSLLTTLQSSVSGALSSKVGLDQGIASSIASSIVPVIVNAISQNATGSAGSGFSIENIMKAFGGGSSSSSGGGLLGMLGGLFKGKG